VERGKGEKVKRPLSSIGRLTERVGGKIAGGSIVMMRQTHVKVEALIESSIINPLKFGSPRQ